MRPNTEYHAAQVAFERATRQLERIENELVEREGASGQSVAWGVIFYYRSRPANDKEAQKKDAPPTPPCERRPVLFPVSDKMWYHARGVSLLAVRGGRQILSRHAEIHNHGSPMRFYRQDWHDVPVHDNDQLITDYPQFHFRDDHTIMCTLAIAFFRTKAKAHAFMRKIFSAPPVKEKD
jgi:hypothetical protein